MATSSLHTKHTYTSGLQILPTCSFTISLGKPIYRLACNHGADTSNKSSGRTKYLWLCILMLSVNARTNLDEVGVDHMNTKLKITNWLLTNNCMISPQEVTSMLVSSFMNKYISTFPTYVCC